MNPHFSVIIPLYNKAPYIRKALESIVAQTYSDWDCIIIDDGSTDESLTVVNKYIQSVNSEKRIVNCIRVISQENSGVAAARNRGVRESRGEYVCFLDADDWWVPNFLEDMDRLIKEYPDAGLYATNYIYYKPGKTHVALKLERGYLNYPQSYLQSVAMPVWTGAACMPRKVFEEIGGFPVGIKLGEDFLLWAKTSIHYKVAYCEKTLAYYNNDVPASLRATRNLHEPERQMLFNLQPIETEIECKVESIKCKEDWKTLLDWLRVNGLLEYWMSEEYHEEAAVELNKVDWSKQPKKMVRLYKTPIWVLNAKRRFMLVGSYFKQKVVRRFYV